MNFMMRIWLEASLSREERMGKVTVTVKAIKVKGRNKIPLNFDTKKNE